MMITITKLSSVCSVLKNPSALKSAFLAFVLAPSLILVGCSSTPRVPDTSAVSPTPGTVNPSANSTAHLPFLPPAGSGRGGYYQDDGPGDHPPDGLLSLPDPIPRIEPYSLTGNKPYVVFGQTYTPLVDQQPFKQRGTGSWYGKKFHGQKTSSGELYDMYKLTAAHPTLPIPSYARVTNLNNGAQVIVRINDRGPFHSNRIIDLSYTAALKLGYLGKGSGQLEVERLLPEDIARMNATNKQQASSVPAVKPVAQQMTDAPLVVTALPISAPTSTPISTQVSNQITEKPSIVSVPISLPALPATEKTTADLSSTLENNPPGFYVQFGAYGELSNAESVRSRLLQAWDSSLPPIEISSVGLFYRLQGGPFATRDEALLAGQKIQSIGEIKPMVVQR